MKVKRMIGYIMFGIPLIGLIAAIIAAAVTAGWKTVLMVIGGISLTAGWLFTATALIRKEDKNHD